MAIKRQKTGETDKKGYMTPVTHREGSVTPLDKKGSATPVPPPWVESSKKENPALFSELDTLLRALDRFFYTTPATGEKSYIAELTASRDVILRILGILEAAIPEGRRNEYWFLKYAETKLLTERKRDLFREEMLRQDAPERSLLLLYDSLISLKTVIADLLKNKTLNYMSFTNIGQVISTCIRENVFFNPFRKDLRSEYDVIRNQGITDVVRGIGDKTAKKIFSVILLHLFRLLRYLGHLDDAAQRSAALHSSAVILMLIKSEISAFLVFLDEVSKKLRNRQLQGLLRSVSYQFTMETKRVYLQEMKDIFEKRTPLMMGRIENSHGILKNLAEQTVIQIAQFWKPDIKGEEIFESFITKTEISMALREDIYTLDRLIALLINAGDPEATREPLNTLKAYAGHLENSTFRLIRYDDYEEFASFTEALKGARPDAEDFGKFIERCGHFQIFLDTTLGHISHRAELNDRPLDVDKIEEKIKTLTG